MSLGASGYRVRRASFPRSRGDEPGISQLLEKNGLFSPLTRG